MSSVTHEPRGARSWRDGAVASWITSLDHKRIGVMYVAAAGVFTAVALVVTVLMATQHLRPDLSIVTGNAYRGSVTVHGVLLVFFVLTPLVLGLATALVPLQIGARGITHPGLVTVAFWLLVFGGLAFTLSALGSGGTGRSAWTAYPPLSLAGSGNGEELLLLGLLLATLAVALTATCLLRTILRLRAPGMGWGNVPAFTVSIAVYAAAALLASLVSIGGLVLTLIARESSGTLDFLTDGQTPVLRDATFWLFGNPGAYLLLIPAIGITGEIISVFAGRVRLGGTALRSLLALFAVSLGLVWLHHTLSVSQGTRPATILLVLALVVAVPGAVVLIALARGAAAGLGGRPAAPLPWALGATVLAALGGLSGLFLAIWGSDRDLRGTAFATGHAHLILFGPLLFALAAGLVYWWPKLTGRLLDEKASLGAFARGVPLLRGAGADAAPRRRCRSGTERSHLRRPLRPCGVQPDRVARRVRGLSRVARPARSGPPLRAGRAPRRERSVAGGHPRVVHDLTSPAPQLRHGARCDQLTAIARHPQPGRGSRWRLIAPRSPRARSCG